MSYYYGSGGSVTHETVKAFLSRLRSTCDIFVLKLRVQSARTKKILGISVLIFLYVYLRPYSWLFPDTVTAYESLLERSKCPACFGTRMCEFFYLDGIKLSGSAKFRSLDFLNVRNVYTNAKLMHGSVVIKKMASDDQLIEIDKKICRDAGEQEYCDVSSAFPRTSWVSPFLETPITETALKSNNFLFSCPSDRLLDRMWTNFREYDTMDKISVSDKMKMLYMSAVNPEPLVLQTFPKLEGWPFPEYLGACGRAIVIENGGESLESFYHAEFSVRVSLAYELMLLADTLTTKSDFGLYLADVQLENFVVDYNGKVSLVDLEHVIVVDKLYVKSRAPVGWNIPHQTTFHDCQKEGNCFVFKTSDLCDHELSDHNYYALCRFVLSQYSDDSDYPRGLLHSMPREASDIWDLEYLLNSCANPRPPADRYKVKDKLIQALKGLKDEFQKREGI